jgi:hypothetical protein
LPGRISLPVFGDEPVGPVVNRVEKDHSNPGPFGLFDEASRSYVPRRASCDGYFLA